MGKDKTSRDFWERVDGLLVTLDIGITDLSAELGYDKSTLSRLKTKDSDPKASLVTALARRLGTTTDYLLTGTPPSNAPSGGSSMLDRVLSSAIAMLDEDQKARLLRTAATLDADVATLVDMYRGEMEGAGHDDGMRRELDLRLAGHEVDRLAQALEEACRCAARLTAMSTCAAGDGKDRKDLQGS